MHSQPETQNLDRDESAQSLRIVLPGIPASWQVLDVQVYPSEGGNSVALVLQTDVEDRVVLYARKAETPAEAVPLSESRDNRNLAYWESGPFAYALAGEVSSSRVLSFASTIASTQTGTSATKL